MGALDGNFVNPQEELEPITTTPQQDKELAARFFASLKIAPATGERLFRTAVPEAIQGLHTLAKAPFQEGPILEKLSRARYREGGYENVQNMLTEKQKEFYAANPNATEAEARKFISDYQNTQEYVSKEREQIPSFYAGIEQIAENIDRKYGAPTDAEKTNTEQVGKAILETIVPVSIFSKVSKVPAAARFAAEMVLPGNQATTLAGKAAVGGVAGGITAGVQALAGRDVKSDVHTQEIAKIENPEPAAIAATEFPELNTIDGEVPHTVVGALDEAYTVGEFTKLFSYEQSMGIFAALGAAAAGGKIKPKVMPETTRFATPNKLNAVSPTTGTTFKEAAVSTKNSVVDAFDDRAPVQRAISISQNDYAKGVQGSNELGINSPSGAGMAKTNALVHGRLEGETFTPVNHLIRMRSALVDGDNMPDAPNGKFTEVSEFLHARTELANRRNFTQEAQDKVNAKQLEYSTAMSKGKIPEAEQMLREIQELQTAKLQAEAKRHNLEQHDTDTLQSIVKAGPRGEIAQAYVKAFDEISAIIPKIAHKSETVSAESISNILKKHNGTYAPTIEDELGGATGIARIFAKAKTEADEVNTPLRNLELSVNPFSRRDLDGVKSPDFLLNPHDALMRNLNHFISWQEHQLYKRNAVEKMRTGPNFKSLLDDKEPNGGIYKNGNRTKFSDDHIYAMIKANDTDFSGYTAVKHTGDGGLTTFYKFKDRSLAHALDAQPMDISVQAGIKQFATRTFTGVWNLGFAPMSVALETAGMMVNRPKGTFGYIDYAAEKAARKITGKSAPQGLIDAARIGGLIPDIAIGQMHAILKTLELTYKTNRLAIADNILSGLKSQDGWFDTILRTPEGRAWGTKWAQKVVDGYQDTLEASLVDSRSINLSSITPMQENMTRMDSWVDLHLSDYVGPLGAKIARMTGSVAALPLQQYKMLITNYRDVTKLIFAERGMAILEAKHGTKAAIPIKEIEKLHTWVRTGTGDFTKRMGNQKMRYLDDMVPYFRVMIQSTKNFTQSMVRDPRVAAGVLGLTTSKIGFEYLMANWDDDAYDWYYRQQTGADRAASIGIVRPDIMMKIIAGEKVPFKPEYVWRMFTPQEIRPYIEGIAQGVRGLGAYNAGQNDKEASTGGMFGQALGQALGIATPPGMAAALATQGVKIELSNIFKDDKIIDTRGVNKADSSIIDGSSVSRGLYNTIGAVFGTIGRNLAEAYTTAEFESKQGKSVVDAVYGGAREFGQRMTAPTKVESVPYTGGQLWATNVNARRYRFTSTAAKLYELRGAFIEVGRLSEDQKEVIAASPVLSAITDELRLSGKSQDYKDFTERYKEIDKGIKAIENNRSVPYAKRQELLQTGLKDLHELSKEQNTWMVQQETELATMKLQDGIILGEQFKKMTGEDFTLKAFRDVIKQTKDKIRR